MKLKNTEFAILLEIPNRRVSATVFELVGSFYKNSKQPLKKAKTILKHLRRMEKNGLVKRMPGNGAIFTEVRWQITPDGIVEGKRENTARLMRADERPTFPRLAE